MSTQHSSGQKRTEEESTRMASPECQDWGLAGERAGRHWKGTEAQRPSPVRLAWGYSWEVVSEAKFLISEKKRFLVPVLVLVGEEDRGPSEGTKRALCREQNGNRLEENHAVWDRIGDRGKGLKPRELKSPNPVPHASISYRNKHLDPTYQKWQFCLYKSRRWEKKKREGGLNRYF